MFLAKKKDLTNNVRHRRELKWGVFLQTQVRDKYTKKHYSNFVEYKIPAFCFKNYFFNKYSKKLYTIITDSSNNNVLSPSKYGLDIGRVCNNCYYNLVFFKKNDYVNINRTFLTYCASGSVIYYIKNAFSGVRLATSNGVFSVVYKHIKDSRLTKIKLPSGQFRLVPDFSDTYLGRNGNIYHKYIVWGSWGFKFLHKHHKPVVRGVAMNPIDHPNGGRSKVKTPFRNKYNKIAKKGK